MLVIVVLGCKEILSKLPWRRVSLLEIGITNTDGLWRGGISPLNYGKFGYLAQPLLVTIPRSSLCEKKGVAFQHLLSVNSLNLP